MSQQRVFGSIRETSPDVCEHSCMLLPLQLGQGCLLGAVPGMEPDTRRFDVPW